MVTPLPFSEQQLEAQVRQSVHDAEQAVEATSTAQPLIHNLRVTVLLTPAAVSVRLCFAVSYAVVLRELIDTIHMHLTRLFKRAIGPIPLALSFDIDDLLLP